MAAVTIILVVVHIEKLCALAMGNQDKWCLPIAVAEEEKLCDDCALYKKLNEALTYFCRIFNLAKVQFDVNYDG